MPRGDGCVHKADLEFLQEQGMTFLDFDQIPGIREALKTATLDNAIARMEETLIRR